MAWLVHPKAHLSIRLMLNKSHGEAQLTLARTASLQGLGTYAAFRTRPEPGRPQLLSCAQLQALEAAPAVVHFTGPPSVAPSQFLNPYVGPSRSGRTP